FAGEIKNVQNYLAQTDTAISNIQRTRDLLDSGNTRVQDELSNLRGLVASEIDVRDLEKRFEEAYASDGIEDLRAQYKGENEMDGMIARYIDAMAEAKRLDDSFKELERT